MPLDAVINTDKGESVLSMTGKGVLYFRRDMELYRSEQRDGIFQDPTKLDIHMPAGARGLALFVAPDERYMILESFGGEGGYGGADLYLYYKMMNGSWSEPVNLGPKINTGGHERFPSVSPDGQYLFFLRVSDGSDFYWTGAKIIEEFRPKESK
jgi:hypothetical protein